MMNFVGEHPYLTAFLATQLVLLGFVFLFYLLARGAQRQPAPQVNTETAPTGTPPGGAATIATTAGTQASTVVARRWYTSAPNWFYWLLGSALVTAFVVWVFFGDGGTWFDNNAAKIAFWAIVATFVAAAIGGFRGIGGVPGVIVSFVGVIFLIFFLAHQLWYGEAADDVWKHQQRQRAAAAKRAMEPGGEKSVATVLEQRKDRVIPRDIMLSAHGEIEIPNLLRCNGHSISDSELQYVKRTIKYDRVKFESALDRPLNFRVWFYDEHGDCKSDFRKLIAEGMIK